jgi:hypothetical protein
MMIRSVLAETISQESTKLRIIITIHAVQAAEANQANGMVVTPVVKVNFCVVSGIRAPSGAYLCMASVVGGPGLVIAVPIDIAVRFLTGLFFAPQHPGAILGLEDFSQLLDGHGRAPFLSVRLVPRGKVSTRQERLSLLRGVRCRKARWARSKTSRPGGNCSPRHNVERFAPTQCRLNQAGVSQRARC